MGDEDEAKYQKLLRDKERFLSMGYILSDIPIDETHAESLERTRSAQRGSQNEHNGIVNHMNLERATLPNGRETQSRTTISSLDLRQSTACGNSQLTQHHHGRCLEGLAENERPVFLTFEGGRKDFEGIVLLDSGTKDNWISSRVVAEKKLFHKEDPYPDNGILQDFGSHPVKSAGLVQADWIYMHQHIPVEFRIAKDAPFDSLFGYRSLLRWGLIKFQDLSEGRGGAYPLVMPRKLPGTAQGERCEGEDRVRREAEKIEKYREWRDGMYRAGWSWDRERNQFCRLDGENKIWYEGGPHLDFKLDDPVQPSRNL